MKWMSRAGADYDVAMAAASSAGTGTPLLLRRRRRGRLPRGPRLGKEPPRAAFVTYISERQNSRRAARGSPISSRCCIPVANGGGTDAEAAATRGSAADQIRPRRHLILQLVTRPRRRLLAGRPVWIPDAAGPWRRHMPLRDVRRRSRRRRAGGVDRSGMPRFRRFDDNAAARRGEKDHADGQDSHATYVSFQERRHAP